MERHYINTAKIDRIIKIMSEEEEEAEIILQELTDTMDDNWQVIKALNIMDDMNIRGKQIIIAYNGYCKGNIQNFIESIHNRSQNLAGYINSKLSDYPKEYQAVREGAVRTDKLQLPPNPEKKVRIINSENEIIYELKDGDSINVESDENKTRTSICRYLDDYYISLDNHILHIQEFAKIVAVNQYQVFPADKDKRKGMSDRILNRNEFGKPIYEIHYTLSKVAYARVKEVRRKLWI